MPFDLYIDVEKFGDGGWGCIWIVVSPIFGLFSYKDGSYLQKIKGFEPSTFTLIVLSLSWDL